MVHWKGKAYPFQTFHNFFCNSIQLDHTVKIILDSHCIKLYIGLKVMDWFFMQFLRQLGLCFRVETDRKLRFFGLNFFFNSFSIYPFFKSEWRLLWGFFINKLENVDLRIFDWGFCLTHQQNLLRPNYNDLQRPNWGHKF